MRTGDAFSSGDPPPRRPDWPNLRPVLRDRAARLMAPLDTPWLLLLAIPVLVAVPLILPAGLVWPARTLLLPAVWLAARRWGLGAVRPTLVLCLLCTVNLPYVRTSGNLLMIPLLLMTARLAGEPGFAASVLRAERLRAVDYLVLGALFGTSFSIVAFDSAFAISAGAPSIIGPAVAALLGASRIRFRAFAPVLLLAVAARWGLAPLVSSGKVAAFVGYSFGLTPIVALTCCFAFAAGRIFSKPTPPSARYALAASALWIALMPVATANLSMRWPYGEFLGAARARMFGISFEASPLEGFTEPGAPWTLVVLAAALAWRLTPRLFAIRSGLRLAPIAADTILAALGTTLLFSNAEWVMSTFAESGWLNLTRASGAESWATRFLTLLFLSGLAAYLARTLPIEIARTDQPAPTRSFFSGLFGPIWTWIIAILFVISLAIALGVALGVEGTALDTVANQVSAEANELSAIEQNIAEISNRLEAMAETRNRLEIGASPEQDIDFKNMASGNVAN